MLSLSGSRNPSAVSETPSLKPCRNGVMRLAEALSIQQFEGMSQTNPIYPGCDSRVEV